jgi:hypothetical protein
MPQHDSEGHEQGRGVTRRLRHRLANSRANRLLGPAGSARRVVALIATVALVLAGLATVGIGEISSAQPALDGGAWLGSANGTLVHANGISAKIDWTTSVPAGSYTVIQNGTGGFVDQGNGNFSPIDGSSMRVGDPTDMSSPDIQIASGGGRSYVVYLATGVAQEVDPTTLEPVGDAVDLAGPTDSVGVDAAGTLYAALSGVNQIAVVDGDRLSSLIGDGSDAAAKLVTVGTQVAAVDTKAGVVLLLGHKGVRDSIALPGAAGSDLVVPSVESGSTLWITDNTHRSLIGLSMTGDRAQTVNLGDVAGQLGAPAPAGNQVYLFDPSSGSLTGVDVLTGSAKTQKLTTPGTQVELFSKDGLAYVNDFRSPRAFVANDRGVVAPLLKYAAAKPVTSPTVAKTKPVTPKKPPLVKKHPVKRFVPRLTNRSAPRKSNRPPPRRLPRPRPRPVRTTTTTTTRRPRSTTTTSTTDPSSTTTTTTDPGSTTTTSTIDPGSTTTTSTIDPGSTTTTSTIDPGSTTTTLAPGP